jgi:hypothetical protein
MFDEEEDTQSDPPRLLTRSGNPEPNSGNPEPRTKPKAAASTTNRTWAFVDLFENKKPTPPPIPSYTGVYMGGGLRGATRIPDSEYHGLPADICTHNWRKSIEDNARIEAERKAAWAVRLQEIHKQQQT